MIVVDASVALKWAVEETGRERALEVLDLDQELVAPDIIFAELANVFRKKLKSGEIGAEQAYLAMGGVTDALSRTVASTDLWNDALGLAQRLDHSAYDCFYLAVAIGAGTLVSADKKFIDKCKAAGFDAFVADLDDLGRIRPESDQSPVDPSVVADIQRLSAIVEQTFNALGENAAENLGSARLRIIPSTAYAPAFESPAYRRLGTTLKALPSEQLAYLIALGWLGRRYHRLHEWPGLLSNARQMARDGFDKHQAYFMAQMADVGRGLHKLRAAQSDIDAASPGGT